MLLFTVGHRFAGSQFVTGNKQTIGNQNYKFKPRFASSCECRISSNINTLYNYLDPSAVGVACGGVLEDREVGRFAMVCMYDSEKGLYRVVSMVIERNGELNWSSGWDKLSGTEVGVE